MIKFAFLVTTGDETRKKEVHAKSKSEAWVNLFRVIDMGDVKRVVLTDYHLNDF